MQATHSPADYLKQAYLGEVAGEASLRALSSLLPEQSVQLNLLAEVEAATAKMLEAVLLEPVPAAEREQAAAQGLAGLDGLADADWPQLAASILPIAERALVRFQNAHQYAPKDLLPVYQMVTAHEQALVDCLQAEAGGTDGLSFLRSYLGRVAQFSQSAAP